MSSSSSLEMLGDACVAEINNRRREVWMRPPLWTKPEPLFDFNQYLASVDARLDERYEREQ